MEDKQVKESGSLVKNAAPFILGLVLALTFGWWVFPNLIYSQKQQPVAFSHKTHTEVAGMECADCHYLRKDGSFSGIPGTNKCAECHSSPMGSSKAEAEYIEKYVETEREVDWYVHQKQPDNVFFSHAAHSLQTCQSCHAELTNEQELCSTCHLGVDELDNAIYKENRLSKYSKTTMKMWQCERCHANPGHMGQDKVNANNACYTCHK